jgi:hypothetical protein
MIQTENFQADSIKSQQKKTPLFLAITLVLLLFRIIVLAFNKFDIQSFLVSRSFVGNGFLSKPLFSELVFSILIILLLIRKELINKPLLSDLKSGIINSIWFISFPVITGLCLFTFKQHYYFKFQFNEMLLLRWLYFTLTFVAVNWILDINPFHKFLRVFFIILILLLTCYLQDFVSNSEGNVTIFAAISGVGLTQAFSVIAFRKTFKNSFWAGVLSAAFTGILVCCIIFGAVSGSYFTFLFPSIALLLAAISMRGKSLKSGIISLITISGISVLFSLFFPSLFPPKFQDLLRENKKMETKYHETIQDIQINYNDVSVRVALTQIAKVLHAANQVSLENFGISPDIKWITIYGIAPGGFNAVYPQGIEGNFSSQQYIDKILDSTFLKNPNLSHQFPDPINSILHEYSHLYGIFPYQNWVATESEGWATYSATRLSKLIFQKFGPDLWQPSYNYAKFADSINESLLAEHPLIWSHPEEVGAFKMWNDFEQKAGLQKVYKDRWQYTSRDKNAIYIQENTPSLIKDFIKTKIGKDAFDQYSNIPPKKFDELYKADDWKSFGQLCNKKDNEIIKMIEQNRTRQYSVLVPKPGNNRPGFETVVIICLSGLFAFAKLKGNL